MTQELTHDWFSTNENCWKLIIDTLKPKKILEIGSYEGKSACYLIDTCSEYAPVDIFCVDTWQGGDEHQRLPELDKIEVTFQNNISHSMKNAKNPVSFHKRKGESGVELSRLLAENEKGFDLIYIDASHMAADVILDACLSFRLLKTGGVMIFDDYYWKARPELSNEELAKIFMGLDHPKPAIDAFFGLYHNKMEQIKFSNNDENGNPVFMETYQFYLRKICD